MSDANDNRALSDAEILVARARRLARRVQRDDALAHGVSMLRFVVGRERFAVESRFVFAVMRLVDLVPLPGAKAPMAGLTRWRGDVLTVLDLRRVLGGAPGALDDLGHVIVIGHGEPEFGVLADVIDALVTVDPGALHPLPANRQPEIPGLMTGVTSDAVHILDAATLIAHQDSRSDQQRSVPTSPPSSPGFQ